MKTFCFTVDDNIRFLKEITAGEYQSVFEHPYLAMYRRLHRELDLKVQLNLFYRMEGFVLPEMPDRYRREFAENAHWLKLSFHADSERARPYESAGYDQVFRDCKQVNGEIIRFASAEALAKTTTVHYCLATGDGLKALADNGVFGLLGLFGDEMNPQTSYGIEDGMADRLRKGEILKIGPISHAGIDIVLNLFSKEDILAKLKKLTDREGIRVMIHEQYYYADYRAYQPDFEDKLASTFSFLRKQGYQSAFLEDLLTQGRNMVQYAKGGGCDDSD